MIMKEITVRRKNSLCELCGWSMLFFTVTKAFKRIGGVEGVEGDYEGAAWTIQYDGKDQTKKRIDQVIDDMGFSTQ